MRKGYGKIKYDQDTPMQRALQKNLIVFTTFKNHQNMREIASLLTKKGKQVDYEVFEREALKISNNYNKNWLRTEYNTAVTQARRAAEWVDITQTESDYPYLQYISMDDGHVRDEHQQWHNTVLPVSHSWWNTHYPANGFNCRCKTKKLTKDQAEELGITKKPNIETYHSQFNFNAGKEQMIFGENHQYFKDLDESTVEYLKHYSENAAKDKSRW